MDKNRKARTALLINPNSSRETTVMMVEIARANSPRDLSVIGASAKRAPPMIVTPEQLAGAAAEVIEIGCREATKVSGIVIGAFGDPGLQALRKEVVIPVVGLSEASMLEAAAGGRRFGVATVTPDLAASIAGRVRDLDLRHQRLRQGEPRTRVHPGADRRRAPRAHRVPEDPVASRARYAPGDVPVHLRNARVKFAGSA